MNRNDLDSLLRDYDGLTGLAGELGQFDPIHPEQHALDDDARPSIAPWVILATVLAFFLWAFAYPAGAATTDDALTVQSLYFNCKSAEGSPRWALCYAYIAGVGNALQFIGYAQAEHPDPNFRELAICGKITNAALVQAFMNWAEKHPQRWPDHQLAGIVTALTETWPCK
jgi:hypothetical protein